MTDRAAYRFTRTHEWISQDTGVTRVGITDYAQGQLGDVIYVELPRVGSEVTAGGKFGVIESVKAASDLYSPVSGKVVEVNGAIAGQPEIVNQEPYDGGWMMAVELAGAASGELLDEAAYTAFVEGL
ncbi:MAG: glycine cleavage system protein [Chloroflexota bacterium]|jgi:glycine cleavage system H protein|nr:glycine cleavage system protein [Chloroflexota bacterium]